MDMKRIGAALTASLLGASMFIGGGAAIAAQATPAAGDSTGGNYPVAIHQGTCEAPTAQPAYEIANTEPVGTGEDEPTILGTPAGVPVLTASATVDASLDDVGNGGNIIAVHASPEDYATIIACGQIAGPSVDGQLTIALQPVGESTVVGVATLSSDNSGILGLGDDQIQVTVYVFDTGANSPADPTIATPIAPANAPTPTPTPATPAA